MKLLLKKPSQSLNAAFLKVKPIRVDFDKFKVNMRKMIAVVRVNESEEFHKNLISDFLKLTYFENRHFINTNDRTDLVIHTGESANSSVGVLIETKRPKPTAEMITRENINVKAFHELVLYYMRERITKKNLDIKHLIATNVYEWFIFDANTFQRLFADNKEFVKRFQDFEEGRLTDKVTSAFYDEIAKPYIDTLDEISFTYFDLRTYQDILNIEINTKKLSQNLQLDFGEAEALEQEKQLIELYKVLSAEHLLKLPFLNDSNTLDRQFYTELLHIIGLTEVTESGKILIKRKPKNQRESGSLLENTIARLEGLDKLSYFENAKEYGNNKEEQHFGIALELCLTWVNRILFLKLLESQLMGYHKNSREYSFLNIETLPNYDALENLFFNVLAKKIDERDTENSKFRNIPYLNSSLFELSEIEQKTLFISNLNSNREIHLLNPTVLKDRAGKQKTGKLQTLEYLFSFLSSYDFSSEGSLEIQEANKTLINASVLGLIFEKINGYKDGSNYTPGFVTMYMAREVIRPAVVQKFNEVNGWNCQDFVDLYNKISDIKQANEIINSIRVCDPAVGSGHLLVSALNELIAIKSELGILSDKKGRRIKDYFITIENDELIVVDENSKLFEYNFRNPINQNVQETLFYEKQTLIENCLFGVDINPNSVKICRLRLWIELLKNAYYKRESNFTELETLPNIDINIKTGNSLISRFPLDSDLSVALKKSKLSIEEYKITVQSYKNSDNREVKRGLVRLINKIKSTFSTDISSNNPKRKRLEMLEMEYYAQNVQESLLDAELTAVQKKQLEERNKKLLTEIEQLKQELEDLRTNRIYDNAFEWRFEFPELLDDNGDFIGFDVVLANPPYISLGGRFAKIYENQQYETFVRTGDIYALFYEKAYSLIRKNGFLCYITSNKWMRAAYGEKLRQYLINNTNPLLLVDFKLFKVFDSATVDTSILLFQKATNQGNTRICAIKKDFHNPKVIRKYINENFEIKRIDNQQSWILTTDKLVNLIQKIEKVGKPLKDWQIRIYRGILTGFNEAFIIDENIKNQLINSDSRSEEIIKPILRGRDIKRYQANFANIWIINTHNGYTKSDGTKVPRIDIDNYPAIKNHLDQFIDKLQQRIDKGATPYNLRNCAYLEEFDKEKIVYTKASKEKSFSYLKNHGRLILQTAYIITGENLKFLTAVLNGKLFSYVFSEYYQSGGIDGEITVQAMERIPIPSPDFSTEQTINALVDRILEQKQLDPTADTNNLERHIDLLVYKLYELTDEEVKIVEAH